LDKLRAGLARRGITSTVAALSVALAERTVSAAPAGMAGQVSRAAVAEAAVGGGSVLLLWKLLAGAGVAATAAGLLVLPGILHKNRQAASSMPIVAAVQPAAIAAPASVPSSTPASAPALTAAAQSSDTTNKLVLHIVTADSGKPIPSVALDYWLFTGNSVKRMKQMTASPLGVCEVPLPPATATELVLLSQRDGFADTRLQWHMDHGETIPQEYTLRLARPVSIGGTVVDADGNPVAGAVVGFNNQPGPAQDNAIETADFGWPFWITATTGPDGRWQMNRISREAVRTIYGAASHPLHVESELLHVGTDSDAQKRLLAGEYEFQLGRAVEVRGMVVDAHGQPVAQANITVGMIGESSSRATNSGSDGQFHVLGCKPGKTLLSAEAKGYAPTTLDVDLGAGTGPFRLTLKGGRLLCLRVADAAGMPVSNATVWLDTFPRGTSGLNAPVSVQTEFNRKTGPDGRLKWSGAPDGELAFDIFAPGFMRLSREKAPADGQEHVITLPPALTISGTVQDAATGSLVPSFRLVAGWPVTNPVTGAVDARWSSIDRFWMSFNGGKFHHVYDEPVVVVTPNPGFIFKIEAEGYAPFVTRPVALNEGEVQLDAALQPAASITVSVTLPDGRPAAGVDVGIVSPSAGLQLAPGGFSRLIQTGGSVLLTDSQGRFTLKPDDSVTGVIAASAEGYAEATKAALAGEPVMVLQPWGRLEGTLQAEGRPGTNCALLFRLGTGELRSVSTDFTAYQTKTDGAGHFVFEKVPPGKHQLTRLVEVTLTSGSAERAWMHQPLTNVDIRPGETTTVTVDGTGPGTPVP
jgi:protocatechuate 3,4-dioxygenase beta subunit